MYCSSSTRDIPSPLSAQRTNQVRRCVRAWPVDVELDAALAAGGGDPPEDGLLGVLRGLAVLLVRQELGRQLVRDEISVVYAETY